MGKIGVHGSRNTVTQRRREHFDLYRNIMPNIPASICAGG
jgi:hypothetical protein